ncbi:MAG: helix-turn-helix domain-containing protein [Treponema sp.]|jgi:transcriptional regulator with XRE-family HTH domain|nr:helix-turn-helix domain-containing protein [Treponema sp.]
MDSVMFWEHIKEEIKRQNTTQEWVAKKAGISFNTFQGWISKGIYPRVDDAVRIATVLNTSVEYLVTGTLQEWEWGNTRVIETICHHLPQINKHLDAINQVVKDWGN